MRGKLLGGALLDSLPTAGYVDTMQEAQPVTGKAGDGRSTGREDFMRGQMAVVLLLASLTACATTKVGDQASVPIAPAQDTTRFSAPLLRRLAEAADGYRDGVDRFFVVSLESPHEVLREEFLKREDADAAAKVRSTETLHFAAFGPYRTEADSVAQAASVDSVVAFLSDGRRRVYDGSAVDALFWSLPAYDKFVTPYETTVYGVAEAARRRELYRRDQHPGTNSKPLPHYRNSF